MAKTNPRRANSSRRNLIVRRWRMIGAPCALCGKPIDYSLGRIPDPLTGSYRWHPMSFVVDEIIPVALGGDPLDFENTQPAHRICNARKGAKLTPRGGRADPSPRVPSLPQPW